MSDPFDYGQEDGEMSRRYNNNLCLFCGSQPERKCGMWTCPNCGEQWGEPKPKNEPLDGGDLCPNCGEDWLVWGYETESGHPNDPNANGYESLYCQTCDKTFDRRRVGT